jgi:hypothetical protein
MFRPSKEEEEEEYEEEFDEDWSSENDTNEEEDDEFQDKIINSRYMPKEKSKWPAFFQSNLSKNKKLSTNDQSSSKNNNLPQAATSSTLGKNKIDNSSKSKQVNRKDKTQQNSTNKINSKATSTNPPSTANDHFYRNKKNYDHQEEKKKQLNNPQLDSVEHGL